MVEPVSNITGVFTDDKWTLIDYETHIEFREKPGDPDQLQFSRNDTLRRWKPLKQITSYSPAIATIATELEVSTGGLEGGGSWVSTTDPDETYVCTSERIELMEQGTLILGIYQVWQSFHAWQDVTATWITAN